MAYTTTVTVTDQQIVDAICCGVEGGISYWAEAFKLAVPDRKTLTERPWYSDPKLYAQPFVIHVVQHDEHTKDAGRLVTLDNAAIQRGLDWLVANAPRHIECILSENCDADTGDAFIQACVFGELIYG